jgi:hypothetical protein
MFGTIDRIFFSSIFTSELVVMEIVDNSIEPIVLIFKGSYPISWEFWLVDYKSGGLNTSHQLVRVKTKFGSSHILVCCVTNMIPLSCLVKCMLLSLETSPAPIKNQGTTSTNPEICEVEVAGNFKCHDGHCVF